MLALHIYLGGGDVWPRKTCGNQKEAGVDGGTTELMQQEAPLGDCGLGRSEGPSHQSSFRGGQSLERACPA